MARDDTGNRQSPGARDHQPLNEAEASKFPIARMGICFTCLVSGGDHPDVNGVIVHTNRTEHETMKHLLAALFFLAWILPLGAAELPIVNADASTAAPSAMQVCAPETNLADKVARVSQTDCCKGHKGVCGCRAGRIVCCDNTLSPICTCHSEWDFRI